MTLARSAFAAVLAVLAALPALARPAAADHDVPVCIPTGWDHGPVWSCVATVEPPHTPPTPPLCFRDPGAWPPREVCLA